MGDTTEDEPEGEEYEVEAIRDKKVQKGQVLYLVKWFNWPEDANSWEPIDNLSGCQDILQDFEERYAKQKAGEQPKSGSSGKRGRQKEVAGSKGKNPVTVTITEAEPSSKKCCAVMEIRTHCAVEVPAVSDSGDRSKKPAENAPGIEKILRPINYNCVTRDGKREVNISFKALRADAEEVVVDNQFLRCNHPLLLIDFYEDHIQCMNAKKPPEH